MAPVENAQAARPRALAELGFNSLANHEPATSSDDEVSSNVHDLETDDARTIVGVSLGPQQTRLLSFHTPATEKSLAIADGFKDGIDPSDPDLPPTGGVDDDDRAPSDVPIPENIQIPPATPAVYEPEGPIASATNDHDEVPPPWRVEHKSRQRKKGRQSPLRTYDFSRKRKSTRAALLFSWHKLLASRLPTLPKSFTSSTSGFSRNRPAATVAPHPEDYIPDGDTAVCNNSPTADITPTPRSNSASLATSETINEDGRMERQPRRVLSLQDFRVHTSLPRPSLSRGSSHYCSAMSGASPISRTSTLGDDARFLNVRGQVNSRTKAIRDSLYDSNLKLPSLPSLTNLNLEFLRPDFAWSSSGLSGKWPSIRPLPVRARHSSHVSAHSHQTRSLDPSQASRKASVIGGGRIAGSSVESTSVHPHFTKACAELSGDVVILGGYRGSILRSARAPNRRLWVPVKVGLNIRKVDLEVGLNVPEDDEAMPEKIIPDGMLTNIGPVDISKRLFRRLRACDSSQVGQLRVHDYGYDWRLDPNTLSEQLITFLEGLACNRAGTPIRERGATVIAHSLGGLITRHAINQRPELFAGVIFAGTPVTCVNILGPLRKGDDVLLSSRVLTAQVNFTIRTSFALLPLDGKCFFNPTTKEEYPVDFFDPQSWIDNCLSPCVARASPVDLSTPSGIFTSLSTAITNRRNSIFGPSDADELSKIDALTPSTNTTWPSESTTVATHVTIPHDEALAYLATALTRVKRFKQALAHRSSHQESNLYPPLAVIYGKNTPTVYGAKVESREAIRRVDAYDNLAFGSGDGVVLARASMLPENYVAARGGVVSSERGHISLLGDLEAVGRALSAIRRDRSAGVGLGVRGESA